MPGEDLESGPSQSAITNLLLSPISFIKGLQIVLKPFPISTPSIGRSGKYA